MKIGVACCALVLVVRMFSLQVIGYADYKAAAEGEHTFFKKLFPKRGEIFIRELKVEYYYVVGTFYLIHHSLADVTRRHLALANL